MSVSQENLVRLGKLLGKSIHAAMQYPPEQRDEFIKTVINAMVEHLAEKGLTHEQINVIAVNIAEDLWHMIAIDQLHSRIMRASQRNTPG